MKKLCAFHHISTYLHTSKNNAWTSLFKENKKEKRQIISTED